MGDRVIMAADGRTYRLELIEDETGQCKIRVKPRRLGPFVQLGERDVPVSQITSIEFYKGWGGAILRGHIKFVYPGRDDWFGGAIVDFNSQSADQFEEIKTEIEKRMAASRSGTGTDTRLCPYCAEMIKKAAIVCKHCGRDVPPGHAAADSPS